MRVFNKLRHELLNEGKLARYLGYAIGEIVLIVVGILIALHLSDWAEDRNTRQFERKTLLQIQENLQTDHARLTELLANRQRAVASVDRILAIENPENAQELKYWLAHVMHFDRFYVISNAYDVLKSRGLDIVQNDDLRLTLGVYYDSWAQEIQDHNKDIEVGFNRLWIPFIIENIKEFAWNEVAIPDDPAQLLGNSRFINTLAIEQDNHAGTALQLENMIAVNEKLQTLIDGELAGPR